MVYVKFKFISHQQNEQAFKKPTEIEIIDYIRTKIETTFKQGSSHINEIDTLNTTSLNKLIKNLTRCYIELVHDTNKVPKESLEIEGPIEHYYKLLTVLFEIDEKFSPFFEKGLKRDILTKKNSSHTTKKDDDTIDIEMGIKETAPETQEVSVMTKKEEADIGILYNRADFCFNNIIPGLIIILDILGFFYDAERVLSDPNNVGKNYEENPDNILFKGVFSSFFSFFILLMNNVLLGIKYAYLTNWESPIILPCNTGKVVDFNLARNSKDLFGDATTGTPGRFPTLGESGIALFHLNNENSDADLTKQILSEFRNGISAKRFTSSSLFPNGQVFNGMVIVYNSCDKSLPDCEDQRLTTISLARIKHDHSKSFNVKELKRHQHDFATSVNQNKQFITRPLSTILDVSKHVTDPLIGFIGLEASLNILHSFESNIENSEQKRIMLSGDYGIAKSKIANQFKKRIEHNKRYALNPTTLYLTTKDGKLVLKTEKDTTINVFNSSSFYILNKTILSFYMILTTWVYIESTIYHSKNSSENSMYQNTVFHTLLLALSTLLSGINMLGIHYLKNKFEEEVIITSSENKLIASNKTMGEMVPVSKREFGKHHNRFDPSEVILPQKNKAIVRSEDPEKLSAELNHLIDFCIATKKAPILKYPYIYLPSNLAGRIDTSNAQPWTLEDTGYLNEISSFDIGSVQYNNDVKRVKNILIYNIAQYIQDDQETFEYFDNKEKLEELLQFFINKDTNKYIICRQFLMHILRAKDFGFDIKKTFGFHIINQNVPKLQSALKDLNIPTA